MGSVAVQVEGPTQLTLPPFTAPLPEMATVRVEEAALASSQVAFTDRSSDISTVHALSVPVQSPAQPPKTLLPAGVSNTVSVDPVGTVQEHCEPAGEEPQSITVPGGEFSGALALL